MKKLVLYIILSFFTIGTAIAQTNPIPRIIEKDGRHALLVDCKPYFILGGQAHNSSGWPAMLPQVWDAVKAMHLNTLEVPIYWEQIESQQGQFDFSVVNTLLSQARAHNVRLVLLWFGTWKNGSNHYMPEWMKRDAAKYPNITGKSGQPNAALREPFGNPMANTYESGGPTDNVIPIWKAAAPALDLVAPDIYLPGSKTILKVIDLYDRPDNPLLVPEAAFSADRAKYLYEVIAHGGLGFSPFGIDANGQPETAAQTAARVAPFAEDYAMAGRMMRQLAEWAFEGKIKAVVEHEDHAEQAIDLGAWQAIVSFGIGRHNDTKPVDDANGKLMIVQLDANRFMVIGSRCHITFKQMGSNAGRAWQYLRVEEGNYDNGPFNFLRVLNGDETDFGGPRFGEKPVLLKVELVVR